mgnify:FL=1
MFPKESMPVFSYENIHVELEKIKYDIKKLLKKYYFIEVNEYLEKLLEKEREKISEEEKKDRENISRELKEEKEKLLNEGLDKELERRKEKILEKEKEEKEKILVELKKEKEKILEEEKENLLLKLPNPYISQFEFYHQKYINPKMDDSEYLNLEEFIKNLEKEINSNSKLFSEYLEFAKELTKGHSYTEVEIDKSSCKTKIEKSSISEEVIDKIQSKLDEKTEINDIKFRFINRISNTRDTYVLQIEDERSSYKRALVHVEDKRKVTIFLSEKPIAQIYFDLYFLESENGYYDVISTKIRLKNLGKTKFLAEENKLLQIIGKKGDERYILFINNSHIVIEETVTNEIKKFKTANLKNKYFYFEIPLKLSMDDYYTSKNNEGIIKALLKGLKTYALIDRDLTFLAYFTRGAEKSNIYTPRRYKIKMGKETVEYLKVSSLMSIIPKIEINRFDKEQLEKICDHNKKEFFTSTSNFIFLTNDNLKHNHFSFSSVILKDKLVYNINKVDLIEIIEKEDKIVLKFELSIVNYFEKTAKPQKIIQTKEITKLYEKGKTFSEIKNDELLKNVDTFLIL